MSATPELPKVRVDGARFRTDDGKPFVPFGVNYYRPGTGWAPQVWKQFDEDATRQDFARLKALGGNCVRVFLSWGSFYEKPGDLSPDGLAKFDRFLDLADEAGIYVHPTGPDHWEGMPEWVRSDHFADDAVLDALDAFWTQFTRRYKGRTTIFAYDLLNEPTVRWESPYMAAKWNRWLATEYGNRERLAEACGADTSDVTWGDEPIPGKESNPGNRRLLDYQRFRESIADEWTRRQAQAIKSVDPDALVTVGLIQWAIPSLLPTVGHYAAFRPERIAPYLDFMEVHFYPLDKGVYQYRDAEERDRNLAYGEGVVREVARCGKPVVVAEFGWYGGAAFGNHAYASEEAQAEWCSGLVETTAGLACGWLNWGFHDHPQAGDVSIYTGLLKPDGALKAWGRRFAELAAELTNADILPRTLGGRPDLNWDRAVTDPSVGNAFREAYLDAFQRDRP
jgi:endo-1,4-beta-mannosidase